MHFFAIYCAENHVLRTLCGRLRRPKKTRSREQLVVSTHHRFARRNANSQLLSAQFSHCFRMFHVFFPNGSPCFTMLHHFSHVFIMFSPLHHVSQCFRLFYIGKWWWKHWEMVVSPMFHLCPSFFHRLTELLLTISETFVHHFFSVFHTCWTDVSRFATQWLSHFVWHLHIYQGSSWHSPFQNVTMFRHQLTKSCVTLARHRAKWRPRPSAGRER